MKICLVSDFKLKTGYFTLGLALASELVNIGHEVVVMGVGYDQGVEHDYKFSLNPTSTEFVPQQLLRLDEVYHFDWILFLMDVPKQIALYRNIEKNKPGWLDARKTASLFPVESNPFYAGWAAALKKHTKLRFTFSEFGKAECEKAQLPVHVLPYGPSRFWYEEAEMMFADHPFILTVAANQLRKNIPTAMSIALRVMRKLPEMELIHVVITDIDSKDGWDLVEEARQMGFEKDTFALIERATVDDKALRSFYHQASVFLLTSVSEGIGLPIYEAQVQGCPVVATDCCSIPEAVRYANHLIKVAHRTPQAWGNTKHYWPSIKDGVDKVTKVVQSGIRVKVTYPSSESMAWKLDKILDVAGSLVRLSNDPQQKS
jgi:glycosyltransferase involved in cell wall biosynthesis